MGLIYRCQLINGSCLREPYRVRLRVNQIGIREFVDRLVQEFDNEADILKGGDS